jgi:spore coat polysaccharide biosynthesis predicted glycosyltransferase SpsG
MVTLGGDDSKNLTPKILRFLVERYPGLEKHVIIGGAFKNIKEIEAVADTNTHIVYSPDDEGMKAVMTESDIAICSGGQTLYELAFCGVPAVVVAVAENQLNNVSGWEKTGFIENAGFWSDENIIENTAAKFRLMMEYERRLRAVDAGRRIVPGNGADRIVDFIYERKNR